MKIVKFDLSRIHTNEHIEIYYNTCVIQIFEKIYIVHFHEYFLIIKPQKNQDKIHYTHIAKYYIFKQKTTKFIH